MISIESCYFAQMSKYPVTPEKENALIRRMTSLEIYEEDLHEKFIRGSGKGGQKINKTSSCVYILHEPSGFEVKCQRTRSQALNRYHARSELCDKIEEKIRVLESKKQQAMEKIRRQKQRKSRKQKEKILANKKQKAVVKKSRKSVREDED